MRGVILRSLLVIGAGAVVLAAVLYVASTVDARAPEVVSIGVTQPVGGDPELALITTSVEVAFSEPVEADAAEAALRIEPPVAGAVSWSGSTLIFTPDEPLGLESEYTVAMAEGVADLAGNRMARLPPPFTFRTAGRPTVVETVPADEATDVPVDAAIRVRFSTLMDTASVEAGLTIRPAFAHELRWSGELLEIVPAEPLQPDTRYELRINGDDVAGVSIGAPISLAFRTIAPGLAVDTLVPADGVDGIAPATGIAIVFDRPIDPSSVDDAAFTITPPVAGSLEVLPMPGDPSGDDGQGRVLHFTPSGPLPFTTTFEVQLVPGLAAVDGGGLAEPIRWRFTTGPPPSAVSNQITFLSDRSGVMNVWATNPDGTGQRQLSAELSAVLDYAMAPDGSSLVVGDGRRLVFVRADAEGRRVLTGDDHVEVDPVYAPSGDRIAFARLDAASGEGLGLWEWEVGGGEASPIELPADADEPATPEPSGASGSVLRAPRYAPDGQALAFVDAGGAIGILELPSARLTRVPFQAAGPPAWLPDSSALLVAGREQPSAGPSAQLPPIAPLDPDDGSAVFRLARSGTRVAATQLGTGWRLLAIALDGTIAYATDEGWLGTAAGADAVREPSLVRDGRVVTAAFAPGEASLAMVLVDGDDEEVGRLERLDLEDGERTELAPDAAHPRWLP